MAWLLLLLTGLLEVVWATAAGYSQGFTRLGPSLVVVAVIPITFFLLSEVMKRLPAGTAYAVWTGIGSVGTSLVGIATFDDPVGPVRLAGLGAVIGGIMLLKMSEGSKAPKPVR